MMFLRLITVGLLCVLPHLSAHGQAGSMLPNGQNATAAALQALATKAGTAPLTLGGPLSILGQGGAPITATGATGTFQTDASVAANTIYGSGGAVCSGCVVYDALRSVAEQPSGSTVTAVNAIAGYIANHSANTNGGQNSNAVALFGAYYSDADNSTTWGINTTGQDSNTYAIGSGIGRKLVGYEIDLSIVNPLSTANGISILGSSLVQPSYAQGFVVGSLSVQDPTVAKWTHSFVSSSGVSNEAFYAGAMATTGSNVASQPITIVYRNGASVYETYSIQANAGGSLSINGSDTNPIVGTNGKLYGGQGAIVGPVSTSGTNVASQPITLDYFNSAAAAETYSISVNALGGMSINGSDASPSLGTNGLIVAGLGALINPVSASGTNVASRPLTFDYFNGSGVAENYAISVNTVGGMSINGSDANPSIGVNGVMVATKGFNAGTGGGSVFGAATGGALAPGTINVATGYYVNNVTGLACSGTPTSSFASVGGIVTHC